MILHGDMRDVLPTLEADSFEAVICDPPYGLGFMGKGWDHGVPGEEFWRVALRVAKPGAHLLAFGGTRTFHRLAVAIEDAGWEMRDTIMWVYGSGFPKSLDVSKAIDKAAGAEREVVGARSHSSPRMEAGRGISGLKQAGSFAGDYEGERVAVPITAPATPEAARWQGWGTALKPAWEPIIVARKPLVGTVAANVLRYGTGGINVDGCRIEGEPWTAHDATGLGSVKFFTEGDARLIHKEPHALGRWPSNLIHDGSEEVLALFPESERWFNAPRSADGLSRKGNVFESHRGSGMGVGDSGSAARFFYCAKASREDREEGLQALPLRSAGEATDRVDGSAGLNSPRAGASRTNGARNHHPTVKPTSLMRYLVRLVTPPGGRVLDPFCGSGSTGKAAILEGFQFVGIDTEPEYVEIARARCEWAAAQPRQESLL